MTGLLKHGGLRAVHGTTGSQGTAKYGLHNNYYSERFIGDTGVTFSSYEANSDGNRVSPIKRSINKSPRDWPKTVVLSARLVYHQSGSPTGTKYRNWPSSLNGYRSGSIYRITRLGYRR